MASATFDGPPSFSMMLLAGSINRQCSDVRYFCKRICSDFNNRRAYGFALRKFMLADWVKEALDCAQISGAELARQLTLRLGRAIDRAAVQKMTTGARRVAADEMIAIAAITGHPAPDSGFANTAPVISWVSAGSFQQAEQLESFENLPQLGLGDLPPGNWIVLEVQGDSMDRISPPGSFIFVDRDDKRLVPNGCYVIATADGEATYKRYRPNPDRFEPVSVNPAHEPLFPDGAIRIIGRVKRSLLPM